MAATPQPARVNPWLPSFEMLLSHYSKIRDGATVKRMIGGSIDDTSKPASQQWLAEKAATPAHPHEPGAELFGPPHSGEPSRHAYNPRRRRKKLCFCRSGNAQVPHRCGSTSSHVIRGMPVSREPFMRSKGIILFDITFGLNLDTGHGRWAT
jgi:hypothetical protein